MASTLSRRNSVKEGAGSRRGSTEGDVGMFGLKKTLKKGKPVSSELLVPMNDDLNIYDGESIEGSSEAKSKNTWVELFDMIDLTFNNLQNQNKELKRTVNELSSKVNKMAFHDKKDEKPAKKLKSTSSGESTKGLNQDQVVEINHKVDSKIQRVEENIFQWIDEEARSIKDHLEKDINSIRFEVDNKSVDLNSKIQSSIHDFKDEVNLKVAVIDSKINEAIFNEYKFPIDNTIEDSTGAARAILDLKNKLHKNCNTLRFLCSEPLSVQFSIWNKGELKVPQEENEKLLTFNWINCNVGGAVVDDLISDIHSIIIPVSGPYLINLGCEKLGNSGTVYLKANKRERLLEHGRCDVIELDEDDELNVYVTKGTRVKDVNLMGFLLRPRLFITPGTTM